MRRCWNFTNSLDCCPERSCFSGKTRCTRRSIDKQIQRRLAKPLVLDFNNGDRQGTASAVSSERFSRNLLCHGKLLSRRRAKPSAKTKPLQLKPENLFTKKSTRSGRVSMGRDQHDKRSPLDFRKPAGPE